MVDTGWLAAGGPRAWDVEPERVSVKHSVIVNEGIGEVRRQPDHAAEMVTQYVLGTPLKVLGSRDKERWLRIQGTDGYRGWIRSWSVQPVTAKERLGYENGPVVEVDALLGRVYAKATTRSLSIREAPLGARLRRLGRSGNWIRVQLPDEERGYVHARELLIDSKSLRSRQRPKDIPSVVRTAHRFLGVPYQWGGVSPKGIDCSGLIQTVFRLHGVSLPRDARDQYRWAKKETYVLQDLEDIQFGHLIFFGESARKINHVGMSLGEGKFLHSQGRVKIQSLHPEAPDFNRPLYLIFRGASPVLLP